jgi:type IV pilus assembly protein PilW
MNTYTNPPARQAGLSMIELLIALAISSFLIIGITQIYIDNKRNYAFQQSQGEIQEGNRFISLLFDTYLSKAGYRREPYLDDEEAFPAANPSYCEPFKAGQKLTTSKNGTGLCIRYSQLQSEELDCVGNKTTAFDDSNPFSKIAAPVVTIALYVDSGVLYCQSGTTTAELMTGVPGLRLEFGINPSSETSVTQVLSSTDWDNNKGQILQVRYKALVASTNNQRGKGDSAVLDNWLKQASAEEKSLIQSADTGQLYQIASNTVTLRNLTP